MYVSGLICCILTGRTTFEGKAGKGGSGRFPADNGQDTFQHQISVTTLSLCDLLIVLFEQNYELVVQIYCSIAFGVLVC